MKICDVVLNSVWHDPRVTKQVREYIKAGFEVVCVGMKCKRYDEDKIAAMPCRVIVTERDARYGGKQKSILKKLLRAKFRVDSVVQAIIEEKPDVIHANDLDALIPSYLASRKLGCRLIYDSHEICCETRYYDKYWLYDRFMRVTERYIVKRCDLMVCVSHAAAEYFQREFHIEKPLVITNCVLRKDVLDEYPKKHEGFEVLNHGIFHDSRGLEMMRDSCPFFSGKENIRMAARGYGGIEKSLKDQVARDRLDNFLFYPPVDPDMLIREAARSHVGVAVTLPVCLNFELSVSNRLFEYAAAGLPVIMSDIPEHRYLNERYHCGVVIENNEREAFERAVLRLYTDTAFYEECSRNARKLTLDISWEKQFSQLIAYLRSDFGEIKDGEK
jgi:glycosyltransferase involved in cell wall biosynthesis